MKYICRPALAYYGPNGVMAAADVHHSQHRPNMFVRALSKLYEACCDMARVLVLTVLFTPLLVTLPFALQWGWQRRRWMRLLRCVSGLGSTLLLRLMPV